MAFVSLAFSQTSTENPPALSDSSNIPNGSEQLHNPPSTTTERKLTLEEFQPRPALRLKHTVLNQAKFRVVDVHTHLFHRTKHDKKFLEDFVQSMDRNNIAVCVSLDGTLGPPLDAHIEYLWTSHKDRFVIFSNIDWRGEWAPNPSFHDANFVPHVVSQLRLAKMRGVSGLKLFKDFGLRYAYPNGELVAIDDPRWDPIWEACGKLGLPVIMHVADPSAFFQPIDAHNERYEELSRRPQWSFADAKFPRRESLHAARNHVIARHPGTTFIAAHFGNDAEDLSETAEWLDRYPNLYVEFASRISELGRQPRAAQKFFERYQDRILFGTDGPWPETRLKRYWQFLETDDDYFPYAETLVPPQGMWQIYGIQLSDTILQKVYSANAARIVPGVRERLEKR